MFWCLKSHKTVHIFYCTNKSLGLCHCSLPVATGPAHNYNLLHVLSRAVADPAV